MVLTRFDLKKEKPKIQNQIVSRKPFKIGAVFDKCEKNESDKDEALNRKFKYLALEG